MRRPVRDFVRFNPFSGRHTRELCAIMYTIEYVRIYPLCSLYTRESAHTLCAQSPWWTNVREGTSRHIKCRKRWRAVK